MATYLPSTKPTAKYYTLCVAVASTVGLFFAVRAPEIMAMSVGNPLHGMSVVASILALVTLFVSPPVLVSALIRRLGLVGLVLYSLKREMDPGLTSLSAVRDLTGSICLVTGANSGTGYAISQMLVERGATVIMACRSAKRCNAASKEIKDDIASRNSALPNTSGTMDVMFLDLGDLNNVKAFTVEFAVKYPRIDVLVNNAGMIVPAGGRTAQGFEASIGVMHIGHFALTKWLLPLLLSPLAIEGGAEEHPFQGSARIVNVASHAYSMGLFDASLMEGSSGLGDFSGELTDNCATFGPGNMMNCCPLFSCPVTNGYSRAKLANVLHIHELQRRIDLDALELVRNGEEAPRRIVTSSIHPGTVGTGIHWSLEVFSQMMRTSRQASHIILHAIQSNHFVPGAYLDGMGIPQDLQTYRELHLPVHLDAFPAVKESGLPFIHPPAIELFSFDLLFWRGKNHIGSVSGQHSPVATHLVAARLWEVTEQIVANWEKDNI